MGAGFTTHLMKKLRKAQSEESLSSFKRRKEKERWISSQKSPKSKSQASTSENLSSRITSENSISSNSSSNSSKTNERCIAFYESYFEVWDFCIAAYSLFIFRKF